MIAAAHTSTGIRVGELGAWGDGWAVIDGRRYAACAIRIATPSHTPTTDDPVDKTAPAEALGVSGPSPRTAGRSDGGQA